MIRSRIFYPSSIPQAGGTPFAPGVVAACYVRTSSSLPLARPFENLYFNVSQWNCPRRVWSASVPCDISLGDFGHTLLMLHAMFRTWLDHYIIGIPIRRAPVFNLGRVCGDGRSAKGILRNVTTLWLVRLWRYTATCYPLHRLGSRHCVSYVRNVRAFQSLWDRHTICELLGHLQM